MRSALLLLPGFDGTGKLFAPLLAALSDEFTTSSVRYECEVEFDEYFARELTENAASLEAK